MGFKHLVFGWIDYCLFGALFGLSLIIGIYFGFFSKQNTTAEYLFGGKTMNYIPVAISILASFLSGITFLGVPTEVYQHGSQFLVSVIAAFLIGLISAFVTLPVFHRLEVSSCFEYLEIRFSKTVRTIASSTYIVSLFAYIPIVVYVPAIAFSQVTGYNVHAITPIFSIVCIVYTSMGGVKAVIWTDTIQFIFTIAGLIAVVCLGTISIGGLSDVWKLADKGGRIKFFDMSPSLLRRDTFWAATIGLTFSMLSRFGLGQKFVQRFLAIKRESDMKKAVLITTSGWALLQTVCVFTGLLMYAQYHDCDPLKAKLVDRVDQTLPYYVMEIARRIPGLPGIFLAGLVSSALATMSASLNTLSGTIYDTCIDRWIPPSSSKDAKAANIMKGISVIVGLIIIGLIFIVEKLGTVFEISLSLSSSTDSALLGLFLSGLLAPWIGKTGAIAGSCTTLAVISWIVGGAQWHTLNKRIHYPSLPTSIQGCSNLLNETLLQEAVTEPPLNPENQPMILYRIAVLYLTLIGAIIVVAVGSITSYFVGETDFSKVNPDHLSPITRRFLPEKKFYAEIPINQFDLKKIEVSGNAEKLIDQSIFLTTST